MSGYKLKRGDHFDIEDARTTHRLALGQRILRNAGVESTVVHSQGHEDRRHNLTGWTGCDYRCETIWPEWVTPAMFDLAWKLADEIQTKRGEYNRSAAYRAKAEAMKRAKEAGDQFAHIPATAWKEDE
jgi:hypothetical protein